MKHYQVSRREFLTQSSIALGALALPWALTGAEAHTALNANTLTTSMWSPVVSLHSDQIYVDLCGTAIPHQARCMIGAAQPLMALSEAELRMQHPYL